MRRIQGTQPYVWVIVACALVAIFYFTAVKLIKEDYPNSDFFSYWLAGHMMWSGQDPYSTSQWEEGHRQFGASWISDPTFLYPLPLALFFAPLGLLPLYAAYVGWVMLLQVMLVIAALLLLFLWANPHWKPYLFPTLAGLALFRPTLITLLGGELSGWLLLISVLVIYCWVQGKWTAGGLLLPLLLLKPNIGLPIVVLLAAWLGMRRQMGALAGVVLSSVALLMIGLALNAHWVQEYLTIGNSKLLQTFGYSPTLWGLAAYLTGFQPRDSLILGGLAASAMLGGCFSLLADQQKNREPAWVCSLVIATTLLITPYTWPYDQLLLVIPIFALLGDMVNRDSPYLFSASAFILLDLLVLGLFALSMKIQMEVLNGLLPLVLYSFLFYRIKKAPHAIS